VIVTWYRGGWCPYCNIALRGFHKSLPEIRAAGASLVAISPETPDKSMSTAEKNHLEYEVLSDKGNKVASAYGVSYKIPKIIADQFKGRLDLAKHNGDDSGELPLGVTYVIDREGIIRFAFIDADYRKRAEPAEVLAVLRNLEKKP
jgi:peroxiredoxin